MIIRFPLSDTNDQKAEKETAFILIGERTKGFNYIKDRTAFEEEVKHFANFILANMTVPGVEIFIQQAQHLLEEIKNNRETILSELAESREFIEKRFGVSQNE